MIRVITNLPNYNIGKPIWIKDPDSEEIIIDHYIAQDAKLKLQIRNCPPSTTRLNIMFGSTILGTIIARKTSGVWRYFTFTVKSSDNYPIE